MRIGVMGTGTVGHAISSRLVELGHEVVMGSREQSNPKAVDWASSQPGGQARAGTFADAAQHGEVLVNATAGAGSLAALAAAGAENLAGKVLIDIANPLDFSAGFPPTLFVANTDSLGEQIQRAYPATRVVKSLNTITADVMVHPDHVPGRHNVFVAGDDEAAKQRVRELLESFGWPAGSVIDLGGIRSARGTEMYLILWLGLMGVQGTAVFNIGVQRG